MTATHPRVALVVDDDDIVRRLVRRVLEADEFEVVEAKDGESALEMATVARPAVVLLDIMMPGLDGIEVCRRLDHQQLKVVVVTGRDEPELERVCSQAGANAFVTKPFSSNELLDLVADLVAG